MNNYYIIIGPHINYHPFIGCYALDTVMEYQIVNHRPTIVEVIIRPVHIIAARVSSTTYKKYVLRLKQSSVSGSISA